MGRCVLRCHIRGYSVCLCPIKGTPGLKELKRICNKHVSSTTSPRPPSNLNITTVIKHQEVCTEHSYQSFRGIGCIQIGAQVLYSTYLPTRKIKYPVQNWQKMKFQCFYISTSILLFKQCIINNLSPRITCYSELGGSGNSEVNNGRCLRLGSV